MMPVLLTVGQVARRLHRARSTVRWYANHGRLVVVCLERGARRFDCEDVERLGAALRTIEQWRRWCRFCGDPIPQQRTYCQKVECGHRRLRIRQRRFAAGFRERYGTSYRTWRRQKDCQAERS